jgi:hypothetical protein
MKKYILLLIALATMLLSLNGCVGRHPYQNSGGGNDHDDSEWRFDTPPPGGGAGI